MTADHEVTRIVRSWLADDGVTVLPDRVLDAALDVTRTTPQRRSLRSARRDSPMTAFNRWLLAGAATIAVVFGVWLAAGTPHGGVGIPAVTPTASASPTPSPTPSPTTTVRVTASVSPGPSIGSLLPIGSDPFAPGIRHSDRFVVPLTLDLPAGWTGLEDRPGLILLVRTQDGKPFGTVPNTALLGIYALAGVFADPCHDQRPIAPAPTSVAGFVDALTSQVGFRPSPVKDVTLGGAAAKRFDLVARIAAGKCPNEPPNQWTYAAPQELPMTANNSVSETQERLWVVDVDGTILLVNAQVHPDLAGDLPEAQRIVESIRWK